MKRFLWLFFFRTQIEQLYFIALARANCRTRKNPIKCTRISVFWHSSEGLQLVIGLTWSGSVLMSIDYSALLEVRKKHIIPSSASGEVEVYRIYGEPVFPIFFFYLYFFSWCGCWMLLVLQCNWCRNSLNIVIIRKSFLGGIAGLLFAFKLPMLYVATIAVLYSHHKIHVVLWTQTMLIKCELNARCCAGVDRPQQNLL